MSEIADALALTLAALFGLAAALNLAAPGFLRRAYARWEFARGFQYVAGTALGFTALFLVLPQTRIWGGILGAMILFITVVMLLNRGKYTYAVPAMLLMLALAPAMA
jgi:hypothetical protein